MLVGGVKPDEMDLKEDAEEGAKALGVDSIVRWKKSHLGPRMAVDLDIDG